MTPAPAIATAETRPALRNYICLSLLQLLVPWWFYRHDRFTMRFLTVRVYFAVVEVLQRRQGYLRHGPLSPRAWQELQDLTGCPSPKRLQRALHDLRQTGILPADPQDWTLFTQQQQLHECPSELALWLASFSRQRSYRVPRDFVKALAWQTSGSPACMALFLALSVRLWWYRDDSYVMGRGFLAASWVAQRFQVQERSVQRSIDRCTAEGWLQRLPSSPQHQRRHGGLTQMVLCPVLRQPHTSASEIVTPADTRLSPQESPPSPLLKSCDPPQGKKSHYPRRRKDGRKIQALRTHLEAANVPDLSVMTPRAPTMEHITLADLQDAHRVEQYYQAFCAQGIVQPSEANRLRVHTAAVHALNVGRNPGGLFIANVRAHHWHLPTPQEEDNARRRIHRLTLPAAERLTSTQKAALALVTKHDTQQPAHETPAATCPHAHVRPSHAYRQGLWYFWCEDCACVLEPPRPHTPADRAAAPETDPTLQDPLWCRVLEWLRARVTATQYTIWLAPLRPQTLTPGLLQIAISQPFIQAWVIEHYQALIIDALLAVTGENYQVTFCV